MRNVALFYEEYRDNMRMYQSSDIKGKTLQVLANAAKALSKLAHIGRTDGLLALEDESNSMEIQNLPLGDELKSLLNLVVEGIDADILESIAFKRYYSRCYESLEGLIFLMFLDICLEIQAGMEPYIIVESIMALLPKELEAEFCENAPEKVEDADMESGWKALWNRVQKYPVRELPEDVRLIDKCIIHMNDADLQRVIREVGEKDLAAYMKVMNGVAIKKLYDNLTGKNKEEIYRQFQSLGSMSEANVKRAAGDILKIIRRLEDEGEIRISVSDAQLQ